jgi:ankyrin repeat protein
MTGADVDAKNHAEETPLHQAAHSGHVDVARLLLDRGIGCYILLWCYLSLAGHGEFDIQWLCLG